ncbi:MAG: hypothetical protein R3B70_10645 [Polyangiaceae bacterium]
MDLMDPDMRARALTLIEDQINLLGDHGIRTVLLSGSHDGGSKRARLEYGKWLEDLGQRLANNPYLIAYDPMNEPLYFFDAVASDLGCTEPDEPLDRCKDLAIATSKDSPHAARPEPPDLHRPGRSRLGVHLGIGVGEGSLHLVPCLSEPARAVG